MLHFRKPRVGAVRRASRGFARGIPTRVRARLAFDDIPEHVAHDFVHRRRARGRSAGVVIVVLDRLAHDLIRRRRRRRRRARGCW